MKNTDELCKEITMEYLYPNEKVRKFLVDDLNEELNEVIDNNTLICKGNEDNCIREQNLWQNIISVGNFLQKNNYYKEVIRENFGSKDIIDIIRLAITNYIFTLCNIEPKWMGINIWTDKRCITYENWDSDNVA